MKEKIKFYDIEESITTKEGLTTYIKEEDLKGSIAFSKKILSSVPFYYNGKEFFSASFWHIFSTITQITRTSEGQSYYPLLFITKQNLPEIESSFGETSTNYSLTINTNGQIEYDQTKLGEQKKIGGTNYALEVVNDKFTNFKSNTLYFITE